MKKYERKRSFWQSLLWERDNDFNPSWCLCALLAFTGIGAVVCECVFGVHLSNAAWAWLGTAFMALLIASVPISRAKILASSRLAEAPQAIAQAVTTASNPESAIEQVAELLKTDPTGKHAIRDALSELSGSL